jgi:hypothetical protein
MTSRKKPGVAFWATVVVVVVLVAYPLSFGPVCWWFSPRIGLTRDCVVAPAIYLPIGRVYFSVEHGGWIERTITWYATLRHESVQVRYDADPSAFFQIERTN